MDTSTQQLADRAKAIYRERWQSIFEETHPDEFVAIEPDSGDYFLAKSFSHAVANARLAHPTRISFVIRVGHAAAFHIGGLDV